MGAITALATGAVVFVIVGTYLYMRIAPAASRMLASPRRRRIEQRKEEAETEAKGELNKARIELNAKKDELLGYEQELTDKQRSNAGLEAQQDRWKSADTEAAEIVKRLDDIVNDVAPDARITHTNHRGVRETRASELAESDSASQGSTTPSRHLGVPETKASELLGSGTTAQGAAQGPATSPHLRGQDKGPRRSGQGP